MCRWAAAPVSASLPAPAASLRASCATSAAGTLPSSPRSYPILRMGEGARLDALLRLGTIVLLHVVADPGEDLRRHRHVVDRVTAVEPAPGFFGARRDIER